MTATLHDLLKSYREGGVFPSYDQLAAIAGQDQIGAAVRGEAVALREALDLAATWIENIKPEELELWRDVKATDIRRVLRAAPVSARAADAPSEPSEHAKFQAAYARINNSTPGGGWADLDGGTDNYFEPDVQTEWLLWKSRASDALDSQPTAPTINYVRSEWESMCRKAVAVLNKHIVPDGISDRDALSELYGIFDSDEYRATGAIEQDACEARQAVQMGIDRTVAAMAASKEPHWLDGEQSALGGKTAREGYAANPEYADLYASSQPTKPDGWISIGDRLPDLHSTVALLDENRWMNTGSSDHNVNWHGAGYLCEFGQKYWSVFGESRSQCLDAVTHWMPIPLAPASSHPTDGGVRNG